MARELNFCRGLKYWQGSYRDTVATSDIACTITHGTDYSNAVVLGYIEHGTGQHQSNTVYSVDGISPALTTIEGGGTQQIKILVKEDGTD